MSRNDLREASLDRVKILSKSIGAEYASVRKVLVSRRERWSVDMEVVGETYRDISKKSLLDESNGKDEETGSGYNDECELDEEDEMEGEIQISLRKESEEKDEEAGELKLPADKTSLLDEANEKDEEPGSGYNDECELEEDDDMEGEVKISKLLADITVETLGLTSTCTDLYLIRG